MAKKATEKMGNRRYSPTQVKRYVLTNGVQWELAETFEDATVRDNGESGFLRVPQAMLRAYSNDVAKYDSHDEHFVCIGQHAEYYGKSSEGFVLDCDGDIALYRILGNVLSKHSYGHCAEEWVVQVSAEPDDDGNLEYNGWGDDNVMRVERWIVGLAPAKEVAEALRKVGD